MKKQKDFTDIYQKITDAIIAQLEAGTPPWIQPWRYDRGEEHKFQPADTSFWPRNAYSGDFYGGSNVLMCWGHMARLSVQDQEPMFVTYRQAGMMGGHVRKGEKGCPVIGFRNDRKQVETDDGDVEERSRVYAFGHVVFHISQCENININRRKVKKKRVSPIPALTDDKNWMKFLEATRANIVYGGNKAFYNLIEDTVYSPKAGQFISRDHHKATICHELVHWTGHSTRLNRQLRNFFGDAYYAQEELIAEIGSAFLCARLGIMNQELRHASYIKDWLTVLKNDKKFIVKAASQAMKAVLFIEELTAGAFIPSKKGTRDAKKIARKVQRPASRSDLRLH